MASRIVAGFVQVAGIACIAIGLGLFVPALGVTVLGVGVLAFGVALERGGN
jgi:hypothetical protein